MTNIDFETKHPRQDSGKFAAKEGSAADIELDAYIAPEPSASQQRVDRLAEKKMLTPIALGRLFGPAADGRDDEDFEDEVSLYHMGSYPDGTDAESESDLDTVQFALELDAERGRRFASRYAAMLRGEDVTLTYAGTEYQANVMSSDGIYLEMKDRRDAEGRYVIDTEIDYISLRDPRLTTITQDEYSIAKNESHTHRISRLGIGGRGFAEGYMEGKEVPA